MSLIEMMAIGLFSTASVVMLIEMIVAFCCYRLNRQIASVYRRYHDRVGVDD